MVYQSTHLVPWLVFAGVSGLLGHFWYDCICYLDHCNSASFIFCAGNRQSKVWWRISRTTWWLCTMSSSRQHLWCKFGYGSSGWLVQIYHWTFHAKLWPYKSSVSCWSSLLCRRMKKLHYCTIGPCLIEFMGQAIHQMACLVWKCHTLQGIALYTDDTRRRVVLTVAEFVAHITLDSSCWYLLLQHCERALVSSAEAHFVHISWRLRGEVVCGRVRYFCIHHFVGWLEVAPSCFFKPRACSYTCLEARCTKIEQSANIAFKWNVIVLK